MLDFKPIISINGRIDGTVSILDRGLAYGDGLFETMLFHQGKLPYWNDHSARLLNDSKRLKISINSDALNQYVSHLIEMSLLRGISEGLIKIIVTRGLAGRGYQPTLSVSPTVVIMLLPLPLIPESFYSEGVDVFICKHKLHHNPVLAGIKHLNKLDYVLASFEWKDTDYHEALLFDVDNYLVEATSRNVFIVKDRQVFTPALHNVGVEGVAKKNIIQLLNTALSIDVKEIPIDVECLLSADEVFLSNSVTGIWPVRSILGAPLRGDNSTEKKSASNDSLVTAVQRLMEEDLDVRVSER